MAAQFFKRSLFVRVVVFVVVTNFILTCAPVSYASICTSDSLRIPAARGRVTGQIGRDLGDVNPEVDPLVLGITISLFKGAQTGGYNIKHAMDDGANGGIFNHSERRGRLEIAMTNMLRGIRSIDKALEQRIKESWTDTLKTENLSDTEITATLEWLRDFQSKPRDEKAIERTARKLVNYIINLQLKQVIAYSDEYSIAQTVLCVGETLSQYEAGRTEEVLRQDLEEILAGITQEQVEKIGLRIAYEPRWAIGTGKTPTAEQIQATHRFIKDTVKGFLGTELDVDYGGSLNKTNCEDIFGLLDVHGSLIGKAAKSPEEIEPVIDAAIREYERTGKLINVGMNWKAEDSTTGLSPLDAFVELFRTKDLSRVQIAIGTPNVKLVRDRMTELEREINAVVLYSGIVVKSQNLGPYTQETLAKRSKATQALYEELEKRFGEKTRPGDVYLRLKKGGRYFALAKENTNDQTLMTAATLDLTDAQTKVEYYASLLEYVSLVSTQTGMGLELIEEKGDRIRTYLSSASTPDATQESFSLGNISGTKYWWGTDKFFQLEYRANLAEPQARPTLITFKRTDRPNGRGWSMIVQPKITVLVNGYGTIGSKAALAARKSGFFVMISDLVVNPRIREAVEKGYAIYLSDTKSADAFEKEAIPVAGTLEELLVSGKVDVVIDGTPGGIGATNLENLYRKYPQVKVVLEGGEKADVVEASFSSSTNYDAAKGKQSVRVVSCNTTAMARIYGQLAKVFPGLYIDNLAQRRGADPGETKGPNPDSISIIPAYHHGPDFRTVLPKAVEANIAGLNTDAGETPMTHFHVHVGTLRTKSGEGLTVEKVQEILEAQSRVGLIEFPKGEFKTPVLFEIFNTMIPEANHPYIIPVQVMASSIPGELKVVYAVPQESNVVPENVNVLQAMFGLYEKDAAIRIVDEVLGIDKIKPALEAKLPVAVKIAKAPKAEPRVAAQATAKPAPTEEEIIFQIAKALNVDKQELSSFIEADRDIYRRTAGETLEDYIKKLGDYLSTTQTEQKARTLIIAPNFFRIGAARSALNEIAKLGKNVKIALYGENAQRLKILVGNEGIITGSNLDEVLAELLKLGISSEDAVLLRAPEDKLDREINMRQLVVEKNIPVTLALAKAVKELLGEATVPAFEEFLKKMAEAEVVSQTAYAENRERLLAMLEEGELFAFSEALIVTQKVAAEIEQARKVSEDFMGEI